MTMQVPPAWATSSVVSTIMLRIVSGQAVALAQVGPVAAGLHQHRAGHEQVHWLCTAPFGWPVVPLV